MDNPDSEFKFNEDFIDCCRYCWGGLNSGLFTCEANTLPLSYNPYSSNINICEERVFYGCKKTNLYCLLIPIATDLNNKLPTWSCGGLNSGLFACKANTLPLSYNPYSSNINICEERVFYGCKKTNLYCLLIPIATDLNNKLPTWSCGGLNSGLFACKANTLPLSYNPYVVKSFTFCMGGLNSGLFTCEANTLPLSYNPYSSNINICEERVFYGCKN
ncbi:hypothetical protein OUZ56_009720 [Daphnia magna]|uniref:Uncharacterized protein n=1 Tax=Daphnia magna TaxID=35525 RepID=A0ABR0AGR6_9CRUS|nr:hypothetical protein OUZ56_009720 [Daphnia magna]